MMSISYHSVNWIKTLIEVSDNDPDATQNWYIPALTLDYHGYNMEPFWEGIENMDLSSERDNESKNAYFQEYARGIIRQIEKTMIERARPTPYEKRR